MLNLFRKSNLEKDRIKKLIRIDFIEQEQWSELLDRSYKEKVFIFKHSTRCGVSSIVLNRFEKKIKQERHEYFLLNILQYRQLSNWIAKELDIRHESPQLIVLKNGEVVDHASHFNLLELVSSNE